MAKVPLQKIRVLGLKKHAKILLQELHKQGVLEISENSAFTETSKLYEHLQDNASLFNTFDLARIDFALKFLASYEPKGSKLDSILRGGKMILSETEAENRFKKSAEKLDAFVESCEKIEEMFVRNQNDIHQINEKITKLIPYKKFGFTLSSDLSTHTTITVIGKISKAKYKEFINEAAEKTNLLDTEELSAEKRETFLRLTYDRSAAETVQGLIQSYGFEVQNLSEDYTEFADNTPVEVIAALEARRTQLQKEISEGHTQCQELAKSLDDMRIVHEFYTWKRDKNQAHEQTLKTKNLFAFEGWIPVASFDSMAHWIKQIFVGEVSMDKISPRKDEKTPAFLKNKTGISSFQIITEMFGAPKDDEIDPTAAMAPFFVVFFGICLSDVGYGLILSLISGFFLIFGKFSAESRKTVLMMLLCGISAFLGGVLLGGYFGMSPDQAPSFLVGADGKFIGQLLDPLVGAGPMTFLIFSFGIGLFQLLFGVLMEGITKLKNKDITGAFADSFAWLFFLIMLVVWALADTIGVDKSLFGNLTLVGAGILILTQGREKKNIIAKLIFGVLGLYGLVDYISNMLSYSRLMALGLATGIIGSAMNMTAGVLGEMVPGIVGVVIAIAFLIFGHSLNFALSLLGAFIHTMRLQFIEFFGRFYSGGAPIYRPFARISNFLMLK